MKTWNLADAQERIEDLVESALGQPRRVELGLGRGAVVVLGAGEYARLAAPAQSLFEFMQASPLAKAIREDGSEFDFERSSDPPRDIDFD